MTRYASGSRTSYALCLTDCVEWMDARAEHSVQAIVTDPPYGLKEYTAKEKDKWAGQKQRR